ncbi:BTAD domain-containing putative transcriptional regulator [Plantactinospora siamensis]|uniref:BTAD domain-containing putative transcriptional regulator n=1 Tax=Plantactinospora siamensis TaxID=555372 RepID=A0ABV6NUP3_9ACTN
MARQSPNAARKAADYGQRPTVFDPPGPPSRPPTFRTLNAAVRVVRLLVTSVVFLVGPPALLWQAFGNPLDRLPTSKEVTDWFGTFEDRLTDQTLIGAAVWALWLIWAVLALLLLADLLGTLTRWRIPALRLPAPLHRLMFGLAGSAALAVTATARPTVAPTPPPTAVSVPSQAVAEGPALIVVGDTQYSYVVQRHDTLSKVAREWLGEADRWPDICALNKHRHFTGGGTLRDCDLIYPGWELRLPADATPPATARPVPPRHRTIPPPRRPAPEPPPVPTPDAALPSAPVPPLADEPSSTAPAERPSSDDHARSDSDGVRLPGGSLIPWALAAALAAAVARVWLHRRRRHTAHTGDLPELTAPVVEMHRQVRRNPDTAAQGDLTAQATDVPDLPLPPPGGLGLTGPGANAAARGVLTTALAAGSPSHPQQRGDVILDRATLAALLDGATVDPWPRLHLTDTLDETMTLLDTHILHRARTADEHASTDLDGSPQPDGSPPLVLIAPAPAAEHTDRLRVALRLGAAHGVRAILLGPWPDGPTLTVTADGHTQLPDGSAAGILGDPAALLDVDTAVAILATLREADTGEPPEPRPAPPPESEAEQPAPDEAAQPAPAPQQVDVVPETADPDGHATVRLQVLGPPSIPDVHLPGRPLRGKAAELAVFLACHPDGADTDTIAEYLLPDARIRQAKQQVHTNASNLRHVLGRAGGPLPGGYLLRRGAVGRYRLHPGTVQVDLWQLRDLLTRARLASTPARTELLREACDLYTAPLADGCDYEWIEPYREKVRRWATEAHLLLAEDLLATDPQAASDLLDKAIRLDRYNEELYRAAMRARHALGDTDGITTVLRALTSALADLDSGPDQPTNQLAAQLLGQR